MNKFIVIGNPISHSYSPRIHALFAAETGIIHHQYGRVLSTLKNFEKTMRDFFDAGGLGANITTPFKNRAFFLCDQLTDRSALAGVVNTIKKQPDGFLLGDNTDGIGMIIDLQRLKLLRKKNKVLLIGAGGAAQGVILSLLNYGCNVTLTNRTFSRAQKVVNLFRHFGDINSISMNKLESPDYDLIINATSTGIDGSIPSIPESIINPSVYCYDMYYQKRDTPFIFWSRRQGALYCSDGLGMLITQAALSFLLWHGVLPPILPVLKVLKYELGYYH